MTREEVEKYINLTGDKEAWENTSVSRIRGYLDGYEKGLEKLDKIRAEIEELQRDMLYASKVEFNDIYKILDKYKAESEVEDGECE